MQNLKEKLFFLLVIFSSNAYTAQEEYPHILVKQADLPRTLYHATNASYMFEVNSPSGAPNGPAFFSNKKTKSLYIDLYHRQEISLIRDREIAYKFLVYPQKIALLKSLAKEALWVEKELGEKLPVVLSGRGSILDRFKGYEKKILDLYKRMSYEGLYDKKNGVLILFDPAHFITIKNIDLLSPPMKLTLSCKDLTISNYHLYLYILYLKNLCFLSEIDFKISSFPFLAKISAQALWQGTAIFKIKQDIRDYNIFEKAPDWVLIYLSQFEEQFGLDAY